MSKYSLYKVEDYLTDDYFVETRLYPTEKSEKFWESLRRQKKIDESEFDAAHILLNTLRENKPIVPDERICRIWEKINEANRKYELKIRRFSIFRYAAAAVLLLGVLIPTVYLYMKPKSEQTIVLYVEASTQRGEIKTVVLPDYTEITLNAGSRIKYPTDLTGDERSVELYGEALFNVTSDPARPFIVKTENMNIKVVGTVFDVKEYADDLTALVSVVSGKVEVGLANEKVILEQNQQVKIGKTTGNIETISINADKYLSWTDGTLYFYRTPIREVVNMLNRQYPQMDIELEEGEFCNTITGEYNKDYQMENYLKGISYTTGLKYKKTGNKYVLFHGQLTIDNEQ